jgi:sugar transferase (PEP-CTERM system associated)
MKLKAFVLVGGDICAALLAMYTGVVVRFGFAGSRAELGEKFYSRFGIFALTLLFTSYLFEIYSLDRVRGRKEILTSIIIAVAVSFGILSIIFFLDPKLVIGRGLLAISLAAFVIYQYSWHVLFHRIFGFSFLTDRIIVLGSGSLAAQMGELVQKSVHRFNHVLAGYVTGGSESQEVAVPQEMILGKVDDLQDIAMRQKAAKIIVALPERGGVFSVRNVLLNCKLHGVEIVDTPSFYEKVTDKLMLENMNISWLIYSAGFRRTALIRALKRTVDVVLSLVGIILVLPFLPFIALLVKLDSPGPVLYRQVRVGFLEKPFVLFKFRSMGQDAERENGAIWARPDDPRVGPIGRFLRKSRLDEIPQLYNVLRGDMSFIGPRPERPEFVEQLDKLIPFYAKRHFIKPGITGWAQVKYHYGSSVDDAYEKLRYDLYYFKNMSPILDTLIVMETFKVVIFQRGGR